MHCPSCGAETSVDQRFCRSCGMDLETVSKLVVAHSSPEALKLEKARSKRANQERMYQSFKLGMSTLHPRYGGAFAAKTLGLAKSFNLIGDLLVFLGMGLMCYTGSRECARALSRSRKLPTSRRHQ